MFTGCRYAHASRVALSGPRLDPRPRHSPGTAWHHSHTSSFGPLLGHSHCIHTGRIRLHHVMGGDRCQPVRRRRYIDVRTSARYRIPSVDRIRRSHAAVLCHCSVRHGRNRHREQFYTAGHKLYISYILLGSGKKM